MQMPQTGVGHMSQADVTSALSLFFSASVLPIAYLGSVTSERKRKEKLLHEFKLLSFDNDDRNAIPSTRAKKQQDAYPQYDDVDVSALGGGLPSHVSEQAEAAGSCLCSRQVGVGRFSWRTRKMPVSKANPPPHVPDLNHVLSAEVRN